MAEKPAVSDVIKDIQADITTIVKGEIELAKAEMMPQAKKAGIGAGLFGAAGYLAINAAMLLFITLGFAVSGLFHLWLSPVWAYTLGFLTTAVILLVLAGLLALIGKSQISLTGPRKTIDQAQLSVTAVKTAVDRGQANVANLDVRRAQELSEASRVS